MEELAKIKAPLSSPSLKTGVSHGLIELGSHSGTRLMLDGGANINVIAVHSRHIIHNLERHEKLQNFEEFLLHFITQSLLDYVYLKFILLPSIYDYFSLSIYYIVTY